MSTTMLYRAPGPHAIHGGMFDYVIVPDEQIEAKLTEGWHRSTTEARAAKAEPLKEAIKSEVPKRAEMIATAEKLGVKIDKRWSDDRIAEAIAKS